MVRSLLLAALIIAAAPSFAPGQDLAAPFRDCDACPEMMALPGGVFTMGSPPDEPGRSDHEGPQREVMITPFAIGVYEVAFAEWDSCVADGFCQAIPSGGRTDMSADRGWGRERQPVIDASWEMITGEGVAEAGFIAWMNSNVEGEPYRLPSEAEWEYAARAGTDTAYSWGADPSGACDHANGADPAVFRFEPTRNLSNCDGFYEIAPVGSFRPNAFGLFDMHGNVWEWVEDCWRGSHSGAPIDGSAWAADDSGDCSRAVLRGGSWLDLPPDLRSAHRLMYPRANRSSAVGFRLARTL